MSIRGRAYNHLALLLGRGKSMGEAVERVREVCPDLPWIDIQALAGAAVRAYSAGAAQHLMDEDTPLSDYQIPPVPDLASAYLYVVEITHNPGQVVHVDIESRQTLSWRQIQRIVDRVLASMPPDPQSPKVSIVKEGTFRVYPPKADPSIPPGTRVARIHRVERSE